jgi:hypothetical protein
MEDTAQSHVLLKVLGLLQGKGGTWQMTHYTVQNLVQGLCSVDIKVHVGQVTCDERRASVCQENHIA